MVATLSQLHHSVEEIGHIAVMCGSHAEEAKVTL